MKRGELMITPADKAEARFAARMRGLAQALYLGPAPAASVVRALRRAVIAAQRDAGWNVSTILRHWVFEFWLGLAPFSWAG